MAEAPVVGRDVPPREHGEPARLGARLASPTMLPLVDHEAERAVVGCWAHGCVDDALDPASISCEGRRNLLLAFDALRASGLLIQPDWRDVVACRQAAFANAQRAAHEVVRLGLWPYDGAPVRELVECVDAVTVPYLVGWYVARLQEAAARRDRIEAAERLLQEAYEHVGR